MRKCLEELKILLKAKAPCIWIDTYEEEDLIKDLKEICSEMGFKLQSWSETNGLTNLPLSVKERIPEPDLKINHEKLFRAIMTAQAKGQKNEVKDENMWVIKDLHLLNDARQIKRILRDAKEIKPTSYNPIIVAAPLVQIPIEWEKLFSVVVYDTPDKEYIANYVKALAATIAKMNTEKHANIIVPSEQDKVHIVEACVGLTMNEIKFALNKSLAKYKELRIQAIMEEKIQLVQKSGVLDYVLPKARFDQIGGNNELKAWIEEVEDSMSDEAVAFGCKKPKGYMAVGIPGCAKSVLAEAIANKWNVPLLKLSMNKIMNKLVGESEKKIDQAFRVAKACAPCVMLWDEVEKMLGGIKSSNSSDAGTTARVFASCLQFLQEDNGVFVVMTSNDISQLPPEFTRAGRLDAIWYFSLPSVEERREIFRIHLNKTGKTISEELINKCADSSQNYTGAEIEQSVMAGIRKAYKRFKTDKNNAITEEDMLAAIGDVIPLYESSKEKINYLEAWAKGRARFTNAKSNKDDFNTTKDQELENEIMSITDF